MKGVVCYLSGITYGILGVFGFCTFLKVLASKQDAIVTILLNTLFGGTFFVILNICKFYIPLNLLSGSCIVFGGFPGVILLIIVKLVFKII